MDLSVELESWRADRPDEWKMDEFIRKASKLEREKVELTARVELLAGHRHELLDLVYNNAIGQVAMGYSINGELMAEHAYAITGIDAASVTNSLPPTDQSLNQIKAEAVLAYNKELRADLDNEMPIRFLQAHGDHYANKICKGE